MGVEQERGGNELNLIPENPGENLSLIKVDWYNRDI